MTILKAELCPPKTTPSVIPHLTAVEERKGLALAIAPTPMDSSPRSKLLQLPPEIRNLIYALAFADTTFIGIAAPHHEKRASSFGKRRMPPLLFTCRQIYWEGSSVLYSDCTVCFPTDIDASFVNDWLACLNPAARNRIRRIHLHIVLGVDLNLPLRDFFVRWVMDLFEPGDFNNSLVDEKRLGGAFEALRNNLGSLKRVDTVIWFRGPVWLLEWEKVVEKTVGLMEIWKGIEELNIVASQRTMKFWRGEAEKRRDFVKEIEGRTEAKANKGHRDKETLAP
ncbi:MAG: hypothetical protein LQ342_006950 [Letrouitia transgressa]|nr:MAG: hypothetical protein LQ342_006950 [Letrouitia transgressa]